MENQRVWKKQSENNPKEPMKITWGLEGYSLKEVYS